MRVSLTISHDTELGHWSFERPQSNAVTLKLLHTALQAVTAEVEKEEAQAATKNGKPDIAIARSMPLELNDRRPRP